MSAPCRKRLRIVELMGDELVVQQYAALVVLAQRGYLTLDQRAFRDTMREEVEYRRLEQEAQALVAQLGGGNP